MLVAVKQRDFSHCHWGCKMLSLLIRPQNVKLHWTLRKQNPQNGGYDSAILSTPRYTFKRMNSMCPHKNLGTKSIAVLIMITQSGSNSHTESCDGWITVPLPHSRLRDKGNEVHICYTVGAWNSPKGRRQAQTVIFHVTCACNLPRADESIDKERRWMTDCQGLVGGDMGRTLMQGWDSECRVVNANVWTTLWLDQKSEFCGMWAGF